MKKLTIIAALLTLSSVAFAGDTPQEPAKVEQTASPVPAQPIDGKFYLEVDSADLNLIGTALMEMPKKLADPLILKLNGQIQKAQKQINDAKDAADASKPRQKK